MPLYYLLALAVGGEIVDLVGETGPVAKIVLLILLIFSLISWAIILSKWSVLRRARVQSGRFLRNFVYLGFNADEADRKVFDGASKASRGPTA